MSLAMGIGLLLALPYVVGLFILVRAIRKTRPKLVAARTAQRALRRDAAAAEEKLTDVLEAMTEGFITVDDEWRVTYINPRGAQMLGRSREQLLRRRMLDAFPEAVDSTIHRQIQRSQREMRPLEFESQYVPGNRWFEIRAYPAADGSMSVYFRDITKRKQAQVAEEADQLAQRFLASAASDLAASLDLESVLAAVAPIAVPTLGDCCFVELFDESGGAHRVEAAWAPHLSTSGERRTSHRLYDSTPRASALIQNARTTIISPVSERVLRQVAANPEELKRLQHAHIRALIVAPLHAGGRSLGAVAVATARRQYGEPDVALVTEFARRVALAADNAILYETARLASQAKSDFLAVMSHELRTPLTTVMGYTDLLLGDVSGTLAPQTRNYVERIHTAALHLLRLIEQILIYTRVEVGREQVHIERIPVNLILREAAALIEPTASEKGLGFRLEVPDQVAYVDSDLTKLRQVLLNLLSNAVKFTDAGEVVLKGRVDRQNIEFTVQDTGIGIAEEHLERVFDSFWQVDQSATRRVGGTGLGLSVARKLTRLLGGDISVASTPGAGSTFTLRLPQAHPIPQGPQLDSTLIHS